MPFAAEEEPAVAVSGATWVVGNHQLWQTTDPGVIFYAARHPSVAMRPEGDRYQAALTVFTSPEVDGRRVIGGSALLSVSLEPPSSAVAPERLRAAWKTHLPAHGYQGPPDIRFMPLPVRGLSVELAIPPASGEVVHAAPEPGIDTGPVSLLVNLTPKGAAEWEQALRGQRDVPGSVYWTYEYLRRLPPARVHARVHGERLYNRLAATLGQDQDGHLAGSLARLQAVWQQAVVDGSIEIEIEWLGVFPAALAATRDDLMAAFAAQAWLLFDRVFAPSPSNPERADRRAGLYTSRWRSASEAVDLDMDLGFGGNHWLRASGEIPLLELLRPLDDSYIHEVVSEVAIPVTVEVPPRDNHPGSGGTGAGQGAASGILDQGGRPMRE